jgi:hypothetical protein
LLVVVAVVTQMEPVIAVAVVVLVVIVLPLLVNLQVAAQVLKHQCL